MLCQEILCRLHGGHLDYGFMGHGLHSKVCHIWTSVHQALNVVMSRHYFAKKFEHVVQSELARRAQADNPALRGSTTAFSRTFSRILSRQRTKPSTDDENNGDMRRRMSFVTKGKFNDFKLRKLRPDMIRRMDAPPQLINPSGLISRHDTLHQERLLDNAEKTSPQEDVESSRFGL